ncbi:MAG: DNA polymerase III subunit alpha [Bacteroidetes bacterium HGW-Bacteroidetes-17]|nr:MAG: DNA polymerase III subunit alpha [Bacteroidetes bacterium HGW-Bacteroidetes-17]
MLLNCHTYFSYKFGVLSVEELITEALKNNYSELCLTDINSTSACIDFIRISKEKGLKPIVGIDFRNGVDQKYIGIAKNNKGFQELNEHLTEYLHQENVFENDAPHFENAFIIYPFIPNQLKKLKENEFIGVKPEQVNKLVVSPWRDHPYKLLILHPVTFRYQRDFNIHRLLRTIDKNTLLTLLPSSEQSSPNEIMPDKTEQFKFWNAYPQLINNTRNFIDQCSIYFEYGKSKNKASFTSSRANDYELLKQEVEKGVLYRFGVASSAVRDRINLELKVIQQMDFCSYFLINWDLVKFARNQGYHYVGRGSGANSMLAYLLRITDVDPIELDLYFERFINPSRSSPPDFDLDFASRERDAVTKYIFDRHGWKHTALVGSYNTFQYRSMIRELGKVFGLPPEDIDELQANKARKDLDHIGKLVLGYGQLIKDFPSHLSVHSSGILISEKPISAYCATMMPPKGFPTAHFSMLEAEDLGLAKFDILGQRGISKIKDTVDMVAQRTRINIDIHQLEQFKRDPKVRFLLKQGMAIGCFYIESPAMRMLLRKLEAEDYLRLVAASSIIRPGVAKSGMMREYILRYRDQERREAAKKALPELYKLLEETYGVMVYQEDVLKVAHLFANLTLAEADILRRGMSWKFKQRNEFHKVRDKFFENCHAKGYPDETIIAIWDQIESFANYAFSKGHSASYAVESFQALYLKAYYPLEYMTATVNNGGGFYHTELYLHEARMHGAIIEAPCINQSDSSCILIDKQIYIGLAFIKNFETNSIRNILKERQNGVFTSLEEFVRRVEISLDQLIILIKVGGFRTINPNKKELLWEAHLYLSKGKKSKPAKQLFTEKAKRYHLPDLTHLPIEDAFDEIDLLGFPVKASPFDLLKEKPDLQLRAKDLKSKIGKQVEMLAYLVHVKGTLTGEGKRMSFGVFTDLDGEWVDTVQFPETAKQYPFLGYGCYILKGKVVEEFGFISIEINRHKRLKNLTIDDC